MGAATWVDPSAGSTSTLFRYGSSSKVAGHSLLDVDQMLISLSVA